MGVGSMSNVTSAKRYTEQVAESNKSLTRERDTLKTRSTSLDERAKDLESRLHHVTDEKDQLKFASSALEEAGKRMDEWVSTIMEEKRDLQSSLKAAQDRVAELVSRATTLQEERSSAQMREAVCNTERDAAAHRAEQEQSRLREDRNRLQSVATFSEERVKELSETLETTSTENHAIKQRVAVAEAEARRLEDRLQRAEVSGSALQADKDSLTLRVSKMELEHKEALKEMVRQRDVSNMERNAATEAKIVAKGELERTREVLVVIERQQEAYREEVASAQLRASAAEERCKGMQAERDTREEESVRLREQLSTCIAERRGKEELALKLEQQLTLTTEEKKQLDARAETAEQTVASLQKARAEAADALLQQRDEARKEIEALAAAQADRQRLGDAVRKAEQNLADERAALIDRAEFAEQRCKQLSEQNETATTERAQQRETIVAVQEAKAKLTEGLAVAQAEKRASDELARKAEARSAECNVLKDQVLSERNRAQELAATLQGEKRILEETVARLEGQVGKVQHELGDQEVKAQIASQRAADALQQRDTLQQEKSACDASVSELRESSMQLKVDLLSSHADVRLHSDRATRLEQQLSKAHEDTAEELKRADTANERAASVQKQFEQAGADQTRPSPSPPPPPLTHTLHPHPSPPPPPPPPRRLLIGRRHRSSSWRPRSSCGRSTRRSARGTPRLAA